MPSIMVLNCWQVRNTPALQYPVIPLFKVQNLKNWIIQYAKHFLGYTKHNSDALLYSKLQHTHLPNTFFVLLTLTLLTWRIWWAPNIASKWDLTQRLKG